MRLAARIVGVVSILLYGIALVVPAVDARVFENGKSTFILSGWECLVQGFDVLPYWLANPLLFGAWFALFRGSRLSAYWAVGAMGIAVMFTLSVLGNDPSKNSGTWPKEGYWLWMISIGLATIAGFMLVFAKPVPQTPR